MNRTVTVAGYVVLAVAALAYQLVGLMGRRTVTVGEALRPVKSSRSGRIILLAVWMWAGWHLFVRAAWS